MGRLRPRNRAPFSGFTNAEIEKMEKLARVSKGQSLDREFYQKLAKNFNCSSGRAGKPIIKWTEIQSWFETRLQDSPQVAENELMSPQGLQCKEVPKLVPALCPTWPSPLRRRRSRTVESMNDVALHSDQVIMADSSTNPPTKKKTRRATTLQQLTSRRTVIMADSSTNPPTEKTRRATTLEQLTSRRTSIMAGSSTNPPTKKNTRRATTLEKFTSRRPPGYRYPLEFDQVTRDPVGDFAAKFKSYVAMLARNKASILAEAWDKVDGEVKNLIWQDILEMFDIPNDERLKKQWIAYAGERWTQFKTTLTRQYIFGSGDNQGNTTPCEKYNISTETWELFVKSRMEEKFLSKRERAKKVQSNNHFYHTASRGGYKLIKAKWKKDYVEARREESGDPDLIIDPPSPPRHELFKLAHQRQTGSFTTDESAFVASKIDELVNKITQGTFVPHGRQDILTTAIGKPEHPGRVRGVGRGVGITQYFGPTSRSDLYNEKLASMKQELRQELTQEFEKKCKDLKQELREELIQFDSQKLGSYGGPPNGFKGSCSPSHVEEPLNVEELLSSPSHVEEPLNVEEPLKNDWLKELYFASYDMTENIKFDLDHEPQEHFYIGYKEIVHMVKGDENLELSHLGIWCTYLHRECIARGIIGVYGFLDPYKICGSYSYKAETIQTYIQNKLIDQNKTCFLAPYLFNKHWQLFVICPIVNTVVWMCSLHNTPDETLVEIVENAMDEYNRMKGLRKPKPQWVTPKVAKQNNGYSCGHYVMKNMMTIVSATITNNWRKVFNTSRPFTFEELKHVRQVWAEFFLKLYAERKSLGKKERSKELK